MTEDSADPSQSARPEVILDSDDDEVDVNLQDIPTGTNNDNDNGPDTVALLDTEMGIQTGADPAGDEKKLRFSTHYESFNITGWVLCLLITRKGDRSQGRTATPQPKQPLMEEWISSQAQTGLSEE